MTFKDLAGDPIIVIFCATLPLLASIVWASLQNGNRFAALDKRMDRTDSTLDRIDKRLSSIDDRLAAMSERLAVVETRLEGPGLVRGH